MPPKAAAKGRPEAEPNAPTAEPRPSGSGPSRSAVPLVYDEEDIGRAHAGDRRFVWALARGLELLRAFGPGRGPLGVGELATLTGLAKPTVSRLTYTLSALGYLQVVDRQGRYEPAPALLALGYPVLANLRVRQAAHDPMRRLADDSNAMVGLAGRDRLSMVMVDTTSPSWLVALRLAAGSRVSMATTAMGRAWLAAVEPQARDHVLDRLARRHGAAWPELKARILDGVAQVQARGFCVVDGEWQRDVRTAGAPLVSPGGGTVMAMMIGAPGFSMEVRRLEEELGPRLAQLCRAVEPLLGR